MNYKSVRKIHETFALDEKFEPHLVVKGEAGDVVNRVPITNPMEKGYIYASLFFYDEILKEIEKLRKMVTKIRDELSQEIMIEEPAKLLMELSARVRSAIGDDSLDAFIKEMLATESTAISLLPTAEEEKNLLRVKEAIFIELFQDFIKNTFQSAVDKGDMKSFQFKKEYMETLSARQKKLLSPALRMAGFIQQLRLDNFEMLPDWTVRYKPIKIAEKFDAKEEEIKTSLKKLMAAHQ